MFIYNIVISAHLGNARNKKIENQSYLFYIQIIHEFKKSKDKQGLDSAKSCKRELLSKNMDLNKELIKFSDIDIKTSNIKMRMMLKGKKIIKKYKFITFNIKTLVKNIKQKITLDFPYKSSLIFNYNLTNNKSIINVLTNEIKLNKEKKRTKSSIDINENDDQMCAEESENSDQEKTIKKNNRDITINENINNNISNDKSKLSFKQRLTIFEKKGNAPKNNFSTNINNNIRKNTNIIKNNNNITIKSNISTNVKSNDIKAENTSKEKGKSNEFLLNIKKFEQGFNEKLFNNISSNNNNSKQRPTMKIINKYAITNLEKNNINIKNNLNLKEDDNINQKEKTNIEEIIEDPNENIFNYDNFLEENNNKKESKTVVVKPQNIIKNSNEINKQIIDDDNKIDKEPIFDNSDSDFNIIKSKSEYIKNNISLNNQNLGQLLKSEKIIINKDLSNDSFCNSFFICSFPYKNGKLMENSKNYKSICNHSICGRLLSMEPEIIYKFPSYDIEDLELNNLTASICFPTGIKICYEQDERNIYKNFSTYIINQKGQKYYMSIYHFYRKLDSLSYNKLYLDNPLKLYLRQFGDNIFYSNLEKEQLEKELSECQELGFRDFVFIPYAIVLISTNPYINQMESCLNIIYKIMSNTNHYSELFENDSSLIKDLLYYLIYSIPIPLVNTEISFNLPFSLENIKISSPFKDKARELEDANFPFIISNFCPENIIKIYQYILFEQKILFIYKDIEKISTIINSFINIIYPVDWTYTNIPIMSFHMSKYLQTFLPFINGICEDLFENTAKQTLEDAEEGMFEIFIYDDTIKYSKPDYEDDVLSSIPKLPDDIYKKLYSELSDLGEIYNSLNEKEKEKNAENINILAKNIFFECTCIMIYDLIGFVTDDTKEFKGFTNSALVKLYQNDAIFYKELTETQIFQNFINNFVNKKKDYTSFFCMLYNIAEKYIDIDLSQSKGRTIWKKTVRKISKKDIQQITVLFKLPLHLLDPPEITNYIIEKKEWSDINNALKQKYGEYKNSFLNKTIPENERILSNNFIDIKSESITSEKKIDRYVFPNKSRKKKDDKKNFSDELNRMLTNKKVKSSNLTLKDTDLSDTIKQKIKSKFPVILNSILTNQKTQESEIHLINKKSEFEEILSYIDYALGKEILVKSLYKKGFRVVLCLNENNFLCLNKICIKALESLPDSEENRDNIEFAVKITSSAFYYSKENGNEYLIDELRNNLGKDYFFWNKKSFWNTWQIFENYFAISNYSSYCRIIMHDFSNKLLRIKLDKDFIINYLVSSIGEKMILMEHNNQLSKEAIKINQNIFIENRTQIIDKINSYDYEV